MSSDVEGGPHPITHTSCNHEIHPKETVDTLANIADPHVERIDHAVAQGHHHFTLIGDPGVHSIYAVENEPPLGTSASALYTGKIKAEYAG
ncbi:unnamed protein product [Phytophthora fragariaefolia]|uniref:Unnamed protein product n=1 Tax=Phytophthora fragariaefolia TaxID=1490495 RepID=A0A9W6XXF8_9STRA|nr:unnamed protein product [Phytophthora fragariaefolia]